MQLILKNGIDKIKKYNGTAVLFFVIDGNDIHVGLDSENKKLTDYEKQLLQMSIYHILTNALDVDIDEDLEQKFDNCIDVVQFSDYEKK